MTRDPKTGENLEHRRARQRARKRAWDKANAQLRQRRPAEFFDLFEAAKETSQ